MEKFVKKLLILTNTENIYHIQICKNMVKYRRGVCASMEVSYEQRNR